MNNKLYISGMGMITALGPSVATTVAAVKAGKSGYSVSEFRTSDGDQIIMARVPDRVFEHIDCQIEEEGDVFNYRHERMIRMAIVALQEATSKCEVDESVPFIVALPDDHRNDEGRTPLVPALENNVRPWVNAQLSRKICTGRAAGLEAIDFAFNYLMDQPQEYLLILGVDSYLDDSILSNYKGRVLIHGAGDAFAPSEAACALLLTRSIELADKRNGFVIAIHKPGLAEEKGHLTSDMPYRGDGLDQAFKRALEFQPEESIGSIYSSMNGENHWAKEYGVAYLRNKAKLTDDTKIEHPADCYGDIGAATAPMLVSLAVDYLFSKNNNKRCMVYCSSDKAVRGAVVLEKIHLG